MEAFCGKCNKITVLEKTLSGTQKCSTCGSVVMQSSANLSSGMLINGFLIENKIGQGGMGVVYKSKQINLDRYVALKVLSDDLSQDAEFVERFFREARAAASLSHTNIVQVYDAGSTNGGIYYFAMELVEGETLETRIMRDGIVSPKDAMEIALKIAQALDYAWDKQKLSHGDIKPDNIILNSSGGVKLADLGLAKNHHDERHSKDGIMATPLYAPPEIIAGDIHRIGFKSDMYSFGATFYHMIAGVPPFNESDTDKVLKMHLNDKPKSLKEINIELNPSISKIADDLLLKNPEDRPESWKDVVKALERIHDVERKVFHKTHVSLPNKEKAIDIVSKEGTLPHGKSKLIKSLILSIVCLVSILALLYTVSLGKKNVPVNTGAGADAISNEWQRIKSQIYYVTPDEALGKIEEFMLAHDKSIPENVMQSIAKNKNDILKIKLEKESLKSQIKDFENEMYLVKTLLSSDYSKEPIEKIISFKLRLENILDVSSKKPSLYPISKEDREIINENYLKITGIIIAYEKEQARLQLAAAEKAEKERIEKERLKSEAEMKRRNEALARNKLVDTYYQIVSDFLELPSQKKDPAIFSSSFSELLKNPGIPSEYRNRAGIALALKSMDLSNVFIKYADSFAGKPMPFQGSDPQYKVAEIGEKGIKLVKSMEAVKMNKTLPWKQISPENCLTMLKTNILSQSVSLSDAEKKQIVGFLLLNGLAGEIEGISDKLILSDKNEQLLWQMLVGDFSSAATEKALIDKWNTFCQLKSEAKQIEASVLLNVIFNSPKSIFRTRYHDEMLLLLKEFRSCNPQIDASFLLEGYAPAIKENRFLDALGIASTARGRAYNSENLEPQLKERIDLCMAQAVSKIALTLKIDSVAEIKPPFFRWQNENPAYSMLAYEFLKRSDSLKDNQKALNTMMMTGYLSVGCWKDAFELLKENSAYGIKGISENRQKIFPWTNSFLMADGFLYLRYGADAQAYTAALVEMLKTAESFKAEQNGIMSLCLALEYSLAIRSRISVNDAVNNYDFTKGRDKKLELRLSMLQLLASLDSAELSQEDFEKMTEKYVALFKNEKDMQADLKYLQVVNYVNKGNMSLSEEQQKLISSDKLLNHELSSRLLSAVVAKNMLSGRYINPFGFTVSKINESRNSNLLSGSAWSDNGMIRMSTSPSFARMLDRVNELLDETSIGAIRYYPKLKILQSVLLKIVQTEKNADESLADLKLFLDASGTTSQNDYKTMEGIKTGTPDKMVTHFTSKGRVEDAFWAGIYGLLYFHNDKEKVAAISNDIAMNNSLLSWQERLFVQSIKNIIAGN